MPFFNFILLVFSSLIFVFLRFIRDDILDTLFYFVIIGCALLNFTLSIVILRFKYKIYIAFTWYYYALIVYSNALICIYLLWFWYDFERNFYASFGF